MLTFEQLYKEAVARFMAGPDLIPDAQWMVTNSLFHNALLVAEEKIVSNLDAAELLADMARNYPFPTSAPIPSNHGEADSWIELARTLFADLADNLAEADPVLAAEEDRRRALVPDYS